MAKINDLQVQMAQIQAKLDRARAQMGNLPTRGLPDAPPMPFPEAREDIDRLLERRRQAEVPTVKQNLLETAKELGQAGLSVVGMAPFAANPLGTAAITGVTLGNVVSVGMNAYERERNRRQGSPLQRAEKVYGEGKYQQIMRRQGQERKFR